MNELKSIKELKQFINEYYFVYEPRQSFKGVKINGNISRVLTNNIKTLIDNNISVILKTENYTEKIYWLMNDLKEYPRSCKECNNPLTFFKGFGYDLRKEFCSCSCKATNIIKESHANGTFDTFMEARMKWKEYTLPSGKIIRVQGYEDKALNTLLQSYDEEEIVTQRKLIPAIWYYTLDGVRHRYYPDIFIPKDNLIIEVKSKFTMSMQKEKNMLKEQATKNAGYDFKFMIC
jgi:Zn-dependent M32 family carboxypeptidase